MPFFTWCIPGVSGETFHMIFHHGLVCITIFKNIKKPNVVPEPSAAMIDTQSVKTSQMAESRGFDGNKKVKGRKRHVVVDTMGFPLVVNVHDANLSDSKQAFAIIKILFFWFGTIKMIWADAGYRGKLATYLWSTFLCKLEIASTLSIQ